VTINRARLAVGEGVSTGAKPTVSFLSKAPTDPMTKAIPVYRQGTKQWMTTDDYALYSALQYRPRTGFQTMQTINKLRAMTYTGNLNPMAAFRIASYDAVMAPSMMPKGTSLGPLTQAVDTVGEVMKTLGVTQGELKTPEAWLATIPRTSSRLSGAQGVASGLTWPMGCTEPRQQPPTEWCPDQDLWRTERLISVEDDE
jgi:hypothetical protein